MLPRRFQFHMSEKHSPGLPSLNQSRAARRQRAASGKVALRGGIPPNVFLWGLLLLIVGGFLYFRNAQGELEEQRARLMTKQRATAKALAPKLLPLRDRVEEGALSLAKAEEDFIDSDVEWEKLFRSPGVYLRTRVDDARTLESLRRAAIDSLRDGFSSCLIVDPTAKVPTQGKTCAFGKDCESGEYCNEFKICQRPSSPFNMRMLYRALLVLSEQWIGEVRDAGSDTALVVYDRGLDSVTQVDIPLAIDIYQRSKFALVVLDEDPKGGLPEPISGADESEAERVQRTAHYARIGVWDLQSGKQLARVRAPADGELRDVGTRRAPAGKESLAARTRMANSCGLALAFKEKVMPTQGEDVAEEPSSEAPTSADAPLKAKVDATP
jgi:hypothetical protein